MEVFGPRNPQPTTMRVLLGLFRERSAQRSFCHCHQRKGAKPTFFPRCHVINLLIFRPTLFSPLRTWSPVIQRTWGLQNEQDVGLSLTLPSLPVARVVTSTRPGPIWRTAVLSLIPASPTLLVPEWFVILDLICHLFVISCSGCCLRH